MKKIATLLIAVGLMTTARLTAAPLLCSADFSMTISGATVSFDGIGTGVFPTFSWNFGDGTSEFGEDVTHTYATDGAYMVCLIVTGADSCVAYACDTVYIDGAGGGIDSGTCAAGFTFDIFGGAVDFTNTSEDGGAADVSWYWNFGDGSTSTLEDPAHTFDPGIYTVCLNMFTSDSCESTYCTEIFIGDTPDSTECTSSFEFEISGTEVIFVSTSDGGGEDIAYYSWNFGDGEGSSLENPIHTYAAEGTYIACLTIYTTDSCTSYFCQTIVIEDADTTGSCIAYFYYDYGITPWGIFTMNMSVDGGAGSVSYLWDFGDGTTSTEEEPVHTYASGGDYNVCLTIYADSCVDTYCTIVEISTAIGEEVIFGGISIFPNPVQDVLHIALQDAAGEQANYMILDMTGRIMYTYVPVVSSTNSIIEIPVSSWDSGMYMLHMQFPDGSVHMEKILVVR